jgi:SAM-dependent methyltransferase
MREIDIDAERRFENEKALGGDARANQSKFYWATVIETEKHIKLINLSIREKIVLEIGCASGKDATTYCKFALDYTGIDISDEAIKNCEARNIKNAKFVCTDGHQIPAEDCTFDFVIVNSLLHHLDLETSFVEISRVLKDDGKLLFREPLGTNPFFQFYRYITPGARTVDERPFTFGDLKLMRKYFELEDVTWFGFLNIISGFIRVPLLRNGLSSIDKILSRSPLRYLFWQFSGLARKKVNNTDK